MKSIFSAKFVITRLYLVMTKSMQYTWYCVLKVIVNRLFLKVTNCMFRDLTLQRRKLQHNTCIIISDYPLKSCLVGIPFSKTWNILTNILMCDERLLKSPNVDHSVLVYWSILGQCGLLGRTSHKVVITNSVQVAESLVYGSVRGMYNEMSHSRPDRGCSTDV